MSDSITIKLSAPINRESGKPIDELNIRKPNTGELRGIKLTDVFMMDVGTLATLCQRIVSPTITRAEFDKLDMPDIMDIGAAIIGFFERSPAKMGK